MQLRTLEVEQSYEAHFLWAHRLFHTRLRVVVDERDELRPSMKFSLIGSASDV